MRVAGISVSMVTPKRPALRLVVVDDGSGGGGAATVERVEEVSADDVDIVEQLLNVARAVESRVRGLNVDRVVVRRADVPTQASKKDAPRLRLLTEGAAAAAARSFVVDTRLGMGKELAQWYGSPKADLDAAGAALVTNAGEHSKYGEAAAAALAGLSAP